DLAAEPPAQPRDFLDSLADLAPRHVPKLLKEWMIVRQGRAVAHGVEYALRRPGLLHSLPIVAAIDVPHGPLLLVVFSRFALAVGLVSRPASGLDGRGAIRPPLALDVPENVNAEIRVRGPDFAAHLHIAGKPVVSDIEL